MSTDRTVFTDVAARLGWKFYQGTDPAWMSGYDPEHKFALSVQFDTEDRMCRASLGEAGPYGAMGPYVEGHDALNRALRWLRSPSMPQPGVMRELW